MTIADFMLEAACEKAQSVMLDQVFFRLDSKKFKEFCLHYGFEQSPIDPMTLMFRLPKLDKSESRAREYSERTGVNILRRNPAQPKEQVPWNDARPAIFLPKF